MKNDCIDHTIKKAIFIPHRLMYILLFLSFTSFFLLNSLVAFSQPSGGYSRTQNGLKKGMNLGLSAKIDTIAKKVLKKTGVPSASVAVIKNNKIIYVHTYGNAQLHPKVKAQTDMDYAVGSISKQFTAASILMLEQKGKLSLDDKVSKWFPNLTKANEITVREILSHTSGYRDYWPQEYVPPLMRKHKYPMKIIQDWAEKPLDFAPGTKWQYSNTNYLIAGQIVKKISGLPIYTFVKQHILKPLHMKSVVNFDQGELTDQDAKGYRRNALGPLRPAIHEGSGWVAGVGDLAMTSRDLAKWDLSIINERLLQPQSYKQFETEVLLKSGIGSRYGLGVFVGKFNGHRMISHNGEVSGFTADNLVFPDDSVAVVVLTNQMAGSADRMIARKIARLIFKKRDNQREIRANQVEKIFKGLQKNKIDRSIFTHNANVYFNKQTLQDFKSSLNPLGKPSRIVQYFEANRGGGMIIRNYRAVFSKHTLRILTIWTKRGTDGKIEQFQVSPVN